MQTKATHRSTGIKPGPRAHHSEDGSVLLLSLLVVMIMLGLGIATMWTAMQNNRIGGNLNRRAEAYQAALSGLQRASSILAATPAGWNTVLAGCGGPTDAERGVVLCAGGVPLQNIRVLDAASVSATQATGLDLVAYTVWVRNDDEEGIAVADSDNRVILRSEGIGRDGTSFVALEGVVAQGAAVGLSEAAYSQAGMSAGGGNAGRAAVAP